MLLARIVCIKSLANLQLTTDQFEPQLAPCKLALSRSTNLDYMCSIISSVQQLFQVHLVQELYCSSCKEIL